MNETTTTPPCGPYETERQAFADAEHIYIAARRDHVRGSMTRANAAALRAAFSTAGVKLGAYDQTTLMWLAGWEPQMVQSVIGWIERANIADSRCPCECNSGGFCGGCGHAGCGRR